MDNSCNYYEIIAGGKQYWFWIKADLKAVISMILQGGWLTNSDTAIRCDDIEFIRLNENAESAGIDERYVDLAAVMFVETAGSESMR